jgi:hypothetical protein
MTDLGEAYSHAGSDPGDSETGPVYDVSGGGHIDLFGGDGKAMSLAVEADAGHSATGRKGVMQVVARDGIEPPTPAFSGPRSTTELSGLGVLPRAIGWTAQRCVC